MSNGISNVQIDKYYSGNRLYGGCYSKDLLSRKRPNGKFYVINMQDHNAGDGTHWVMIYDCNPKETIYFDSYGVSPPPVVLRFMRRGGKRMYFSDAQYQTLESSQCGLYCIYVINRLLAGDTMKSIISSELSATDLSNNEKTVSHIRV
jgi:hypothetical protein